jgi:hypothetical protein
MKHGLLLAQTLLGLLTGALFKSVFDITINSGGPIIYQFNTSVGYTGKSLSTISSSGTQTIYGTIPLDTHCYLGFNAGLGAINFSTQNHVIKQVTAPSNQGMLLTGTPTVDSGFAYNQASYTYEIFDVKKYARITKRMGVSTHHV